MLGHAVWSVLAERYDVSASTRKTLDVGDNEAIAAIQKIESRFDWVINAIGITIPFSKQNPRNTYFVNGVFPHILCSIFGKRLIHITTDCVYSGTEGFPYNEESEKSPQDIYGLSKSMGESKNCITLRTSIIGRELGGFTGLLEWFLYQKGKTVKGFTEHYWNGITTRQFGKICGQIIEANDVPPGIYHVFSTTLSKYQMLCAFKEKYKVNCTIVPDGQSKLNRTLTTVKYLNRWLEIPSFEKMLEELP